MKTEEVLFYILGIGFILFVIFGSKTYFLKTEDLRKLFIEDNGDNSFAQMSGVIPTMLGPKLYNNRIKELTCFDKKDDNYKCSINKSTQIRFTLLSGEKQQLYFDTISLKDGFITGSKAHFTKLSHKPIPIDQISKIELQFRHSTKVKI